MLYGKDELLALAGVFRMEEISIPQNSVLIGYNHIQYSGPELLVSHCFRYHFYFISKNIQLLDAITIAYWWSLETEGK